MQDLLANPAVQAGVAPFFVALALAVILGPFRLGGIAVVGAFLVCMHLVSGLQISPLTALRKTLIVVVAGAVLGPVLDFALRPTRIGVALIALAAGGAALWVFWPVLAQKPAQQAWLLGGAAALALAFVVAFSQDQLTGDGIRAGAAALALGLGAGIAAVLSASLSYGLYGIAVGAGAGGYLLPQMIRGKRSAAGSSLVLPAMLAGGLVACGAMLLAQLPWYCVLILALVPVAVRLPGPERAPLWAQAVLFSLYGFAVAAIACGLAWPSS